MKNRKLNATDQSTAMNIVRAGRSLIQQLDAEGVLKFYHDYREGNTKDLSTTGNDGVLSNGKYTGNGIAMTSTAGKDEIPDDSSLDITSEGSLILYSYPYDAEGPSERLFNKRAPGCNYDIYFEFLTFNRISIYDGAATHRIGALNRVGRQYIAIDLKSGEGFKVYVDGEYYTQSAGVPALNDCAANVMICGNHAAGSQYTGIAKAALMCSRRLTAAEHKALYDELRAGG